MSKRNIFMGVIFVLAAVLVVVGQFMSFATIGFWSILAGVVLVAAFVSSLVRLNFTGMFLALALLYTVFDEPLGLPHINFWVLLFASIIAGWGMSLLVRRRTRPGWDNSYQQNAPAGELPPYDPTCGAQPPQEAYPNYVAGEDGNHPSASVTFGATTRYLHSPALESGQFSALFGAVEVYFDQARLAGGRATVNCDATFGSVKLYVPRTWRVEENVNTFLGAFDSDRKMATPMENGPLLMVTGNASFGAVEVEYV